MDNINSKESRYAWVVVGLLWFVALLNYMDRQMLSTMKVSMMVDIHELQSAENFGHLMAVFLWIYALMSPVSGLIADRVNRKRLIVGSLAVWSAVTLSMGFVDSFSQMYVLRAIMGVSEAMYFPAGLALIADYHQGKSRSLAIGIHMTGVYVGQGLGGFGATIAHGYSWQTAFFSFGLVGIVYSIILLIFLKEKRVEKVQAEEKESVSGFMSIIHSLSALFGLISFWVILYYFTAPSFSGWAVKNWLPTLFSTSLNIDMSQAGPISTITIALSSLVGVIFGGILSDRWVQKNIKGRIYTGSIGLSLTIPALFFLGYGNSLFEILIGTILFGLGFGMFDTNNMPILCQFVSNKYRAAGYGFMNMTGITAGAFITGLLGKSSDAGSLGNDFVLLSIPVFIAILLQLIVLKPKFINKT